MFRLTNKCDFYGLFRITPSDECVLLYGDSEGCVNIFVLLNAGESLRTWKKNPKSEGIASISIDVVMTSPTVQLIRWKAHEDWVQQVNRYTTLDKNFAV